MSLAEGPPFITITQSPLFQYLKIHNPQQHAA
jgi:hypothetical protein